MYVLDTNSFRVLESYYPQTFPTFWEQFDALVGEGRLISVEEVRKEIEQSVARQHMIDWVEANRTIFSAPSPEELEFVAEIFRVPHFQQLIGAKQLARGTPVADPFVISRAQIITCTVVTEEVLKPNAAKIPNVCAHFGIDCINLEALLGREGWRY